MKYHPDKNPDEGERVNYQLFFIHVYKFSIRH